MAKSALITGIAGQDGFYLSELLNEKGYQVFGVMRGQSNPKTDEVKRSLPYVHIIEADLTDQSSLSRAIEVSKPDEIYNLAAVSHVGYSFKNPQLTVDVTG